MTTELVKQKKPERAKAEDIENIVVTLGKRGTSPARIGLELRDKHNVAKMKHLGKKITQILKEHKIEFDTDLDFVNKKITKIETHFQENKQDKRAKREIVRYIGLRRKLQKYENKKKKE